jgi:single-strand DNA-binding protein
MATKSSTPPPCVTVTGRLIADPELRHTRAGVPVARLQLATHGTDDTIAVGVIASHRLAEFAAEQTAVGKRVRVDGCLRGRRWIDADGHACYDVDVVASAVEILSARAA